MKYKRLTAEEKAEFYERYGGIAHLEEKWTVRKDDKLVCVLGSHQLPDDVCKAVVTTYEDAGYDVAYEVNVFYPPQVPA